MNFNVNKNVFMMFVFLVGSIFPLVHAMENGFTPIGQALLIDQIEKFGVEIVRGAMKEPKLYYDEHCDVYCKDITILKIETVLEKDESNPLAHMIFAKVEELEAEPINRLYRLANEDYGLFHDLDSSCTYIWEKVKCCTLPKIRVTARLCNKEAIEEVLNSYKQ